MLPLNVEDQISPTKVFRTTTKPLTPNVVPVSGTLRKCSHGIYIPAGDQKSAYCILCGGPGEPADARPVVLPKSSDNPLNVNDRVRANKKVEGACPKCSSTVYVRAEKGSDTNRICADCGHKYHARKTFKELAAEVGVSFDE